MSASGIPAALRAGARRRRLRLPGVGRPRARPRGRAGRVAAPPARLGARARRDRPRAAAARSSSERSRPQTTPGSSPAETRELLQAYGIPLVAERVAASAEARPSQPPRARLPRRRQDGRAGRAQDGDRRRRARPRATRQPSAAAAERIGPTGRSSSRWCGAVPSFSPGSSRIRSSARSSPSARAAFWPSSSARRAFRIAPLTDVDAEELVPAGKAGRLVARLPRRARGRRARTRRPGASARAPRRGSARRSRSST